MSFQIIFQQEALDDVQDGYSWYEDQLPGLGEDFLNELNTILEKLIQNPQYYGYLFDEFRDVRLKRFPYLVVFKIVNRKVFINSVKHCKQRPKYK